ncbi:DUF748 domain-containing protein [Chryseosolibacter indicus]|uniref:DUF748 domain-containing protein n=1 Tax=Chryseosolibacter indicus TaxID=2782351 RepID=A0ABS5VN16_9BACT|nr:DUF748 domain-containing protein [Chryseosolibacter indicus]MBT1702413.1 DUF748 domain-containing protein [Chryseosolibacter indicus]
MPSIKKRTIFITGFLLLFSATLVIVGREILFDYLRNRMEDQLYALRDSGYILNYDSIGVNWQANEVVIHNLKIKRELDTALCKNTDFVSAKLIKACGIRILPLLLKRHLSFEKIEFDSSHVVLHRSFLTKSQSPSKPRREFTIKIDELKLPKLQLEYFDTTGCEANTKYSSNVDVKEFVLSFYEDQPAFFNLSSFKIDSVKIDLPFDFYTFTIKQLSIDQSAKLFKLDTLKIIPQLGKIAFGRKKGFEIDRFEGVIPYLNLYDLVINRSDSLSIQAEKLTVQFFLKVFRDKRLLFKNTYKPLPIEMLKKLTFGLKIPLMVVNKSYVKYEEFALEADSAGSLYFDDLYATIKNIDNTKSNANKEMEMYAESAFLGQGDLKVRATFPWLNSKRYSLNGSLKNMDMKRLNAMLEPALKVRAESGRLHRLSFNFTYDNDISNGMIDLYYNDFKLLTYKSGDKSKNTKESKIAAFKTFLLNTFIIKKNMDERFPDEERKGEIDFERDKSKSIFNYWVKSLLSGIKSAYNIDKLEDSRIKKILEKKDKK